MTRKSKLSGVRAFEQRLEFITNAVDAEMEAASLENAKALQREVVGRIPERTGETKSAFADPSAVRISRKYPGGWQFGLVSKYLRKLAWKAHFIEFGTKGYKRGEVRSYRQAVTAGSQRIGKNGKPIGRPRKNAGFITRRREVARDVPARPAHPFFRPAVEAARAEMMRRWQDALRRAAKARR